MPCSTCGRGEAATELRTEYVIARINTVDGTEAPNWSGTFVHEDRARTTLAREQEGERHPDRYRYELRRRTVNIECGPWELA